MGRVERSGFLPHWPHALREWGGELRVLSAPLKPGGWAGVPQFLFSFTVLTCLQKFNFRTWEMYFFLVVLSKLF